MANVYADELASLMWDRIVTILQSEMNVGPDKIAGSGTNTNGRLQTLNYVHDTIDLWWPQLPVAGVQLVKSDCSERYGQREDYAKITFSIVVAAEATKDPETGLFVLDSAMKQLRTLVADGSGNGIGPILRDKNNFTLNGLASESHVEGAEFQWELPNQADAMPRAYAHITFSARQKVYSVA